MQKSSFVLIPGAGGMAWYWNRVAPILEQAGHEAIAVDLPGDDDRATLSDYADIAAQAIGARSNMIVVAHSLGGFTAPLFCERRAGGYSTEFDLQTYFLHDVPQAVLRDAPRQREQSDAIFQQPYRFKRWPNIPIRVIASADDRFFPLSFQRRVARDRLAAEVEVVSGGHLAALSNPEGVVERLLRIERSWSGR